MTVTLIKGNLRVDKIQQYRKKKQIFDLKYY